MKEEQRKESCTYDTEKKNEHTPVGDEIAIYVLLCKGEHTNVFVPPYTFFDDQEAQQFYDDACYDQQSPCYNKPLIRVLKVFVLRNGQVVWANKEAIGKGKAQYISMDFGLHGKPYIYFNSLLCEEKANIHALTVARVF